MGRRWGHGMLLGMLALFSSVVSADIDEAEPARTNTELEMADDSIVVAAVSSPRQAGSPEFDNEKRRVDVPAAQFEAVYKASLWTGLNGPLRGHAAYLGNLDLKLTLAGEKLYGLPGNTVFAHGLHDHGSKPNKRVGAAQGIDNIEVETNTGKLYQLWMQQQFADDRLSVLAGLYDLNSEFYVTDAAAVFIHPALGIGTDMAQSGRNGPSIFPATSLALRLRVQPSDASYLQTAVLDGVPGDADNPRGTHVRFDDGDGSLHVAEAGLRTGSEDRAGKLAIGYWRYTSRFDHLVDVDSDGAPQRKVSRGGYLLVEQPLWHGSGDGRTITGFARLGLASAAVNEFSHALALGAVWTQPLRGRADDTLGIAVAGARRGAPFLRVAADADAPVARHEITWEMTYRARVTEWLWLQPGLQHLLTYSPDAPRSTLAFMRAEITY
ncbi:MAG: carbohydrate porin [Candidatus Methylophosphatis roskildensis]